MIKKPIADEDSGRGVLSGPQHGEHEKHLQRKKAPVTRRGSFVFNIPNPKYPILRRQHHRLAVITEEKIRDAMQINRLRAGPGAEGEFVVAGAADKRRNIAL